MLTDETRSRLLEEAQEPPQPLARLPVHSGAAGIAFGREEFGLKPTQLLVAEFGTLAPLYTDAEWPPTEGGEFDLPTAPLDQPSLVEMDFPGVQVSLVDLETGEHYAFVRNKSGLPASETSGGGLERPIQLAWGPTGDLYVVDFGTVEIGPGGTKAYPDTGNVWRITQELGKRARYHLGTKEKKAKPSKQDEQKARKEKQPSDILRKPPEGEMEPYDEPESGQGRTRERGMD